MNPLEVWTTRKPRRVAAIRASRGMILFSVLSGLAVIVYALRDVHLRIELRRQERADRSIR